ncbi:MAG TPA: threonine-phosphate decarboxylase CobD [Burkholderiaceae bacterium]|jgi:cobalamin biosynthetic protein CobC
MLEHGGNLATAMAQYGHAREHWLDLSTGVNPQSFPVPQLPSALWHRLPEPNAALHTAASRYYGTAHLMPVAGSQAAIQALPRLRMQGAVTIGAPAYAEHAHRWCTAGHAVRELAYDQLDSAIASSDVLVVCNPNNPTGAMVAPERLLAWANSLAARGGWLVVDEAFIDVEPTGSVAQHAGTRPGLIVLRSLGKFFGLAGVRLGFVIAEQSLQQRLADEIGPWGVSAAAQLIGTAALADTQWQQQTMLQLRRDGLRLRDLLAAYGIESGGTALFQWWREPQAARFAEHMAQHAIWVRKFNGRGEDAVGRNGAAIRLGLPLTENDWDKLHLALDAWFASN